MVVKTAKTAASPMGRMGSASQSGRAHRGRVSVLTYSSYRPLLLYAHVVRSLRERTTCQGDSQLIPLRFAPGWLPDLSQRSWTPSLALACPLHQAIGRQSPEGGVDALRRLPPTLGELRWRSRAV